MKGACKGGACKDPLCSQQKTEDGWNASPTSQPVPCGPRETACDAPDAQLQDVRLVPAAAGGRPRFHPLTRRGGPRTPIFCSVSGELVPPPMTGKGPRRLPRIVQASGLGAFLWPSCKPRRNGVCSGNADTTYNIPAPLGAPRIRPSFINHSGTLGISETDGP